LAGDEHEKSAGAMRKKFAGQAANRMNIEKKEL